MQVIELQKEAMFQLLGYQHNPPKIENQQQENQFQSDIKKLYDRLLDGLSVFGEEGDYGDFALRPDLKDRPSVSGLAPHLREFAISILTEPFLQSDYVGVVYNFVKRDALGYRVIIDQFVHADYTEMVILTAGTIWFCSSNLDARRRLKKNIEILYTPRNGTN